MIIASKSVISSIHNVTSQYPEGIHNVHGMTARNKARKSVREIKHLVNISNLIIFNLGT